MGLSHLGVLSLIYPIAGVTIFLDPWVRLSVVGRGVFSVESHASGPFPSSGQPEPESGKLHDID